MGVRGRNEKRPVQVLKLTGSYNFALRMLIAKGLTNRPSALVY